MTDKFTLDAEALATIAQRTEFGRPELEGIATAARSLSQIANADNGNSTQHAQRVSAAAQKFQQHVRRMSDSLAEREAGGLASLGQARKERLRLETDKAFLPIVTAFQTADSKARLAMLGQAVENGDGRALAALMEVPHYVHGIDPTILSKHMDAAEERHAPDLWERRQRFEHDRQAVKSALSLAQGLATKAVDLPSLEAANAADAAEAELARVTTA